MTAGIPTDRDADTASSSRPLRADAQHNRERLIDAARATFASAPGPIALETIAQEAGVGIGTLYRHFPTREDLIDEVYAAELDAVVADAAELLDTLPPDEALRAWMDRYAEFAGRKRRLVEGSRGRRVSSAAVNSSTRERIGAAVGSFLAAGVRDGTLRGEVSADDVTTLLLGVFLATIGNNGATAQTARLLDLVIRSIRT